MLVERWHFEAIGHTLDAVLCPGFEFGDTSTHHGRSPCKPIRAGTDRSVAFQFARSSKKRRQIRKLRALISSMNLLGLSQASRQATHSEKQGLCMFRLVRGRHDHATFCIRPCFACIMPGRKRIVRRRRGGCRKRRRFARRPASTRQNSRLISHKWGATHAKEFAERDAAALLRKSTPVRLGTTPHKATTQKRLPLRIIGSLMHCANRPFRSA